MFRIPSRRKTFSPRRLFAALAAVLALGVFAASTADAAPHGSRGGSGGRTWSHSGNHNWHGRGYWRGGVVIGASPLYDPYWYQRFPGYPAPVVVPPDPAQYVEADPATLQQQPPAPALTDEERASRLNDMCAHGVFSPDECATRRAELLKEM